MKKLFLTVVVAIALTMSLGSCRRHYQVHYARVPVDTLAHPDSLSTADEDSLFGIDDGEPLMETPEMDFELKAGNRKQERKELDEYLKESGITYDD